MRPGFSLSYLAPRPSQAPGFVEVPLLAPFPKVWIRTEQRFEYPRLDLRTGDHGAIPRILNRTARRTFAQDPSVRGEGEELALELATAQPKGFLCQNSAPLPIESTRGKNRPAAREAVFRSCPRPVCFNLTFLLAVFLSHRGASLHLLALLLGQELRPVRAGRARRRGRLIGFGLSLPACGSRAPQVLLE